jgi:hypothetical protein
LSFRHSNFIYKDSGRSNHKYLREQLRFGGKEQHANEYGAQHPP